MRGGGDLLTTFSGGFATFGTTATLSAASTTPGQNPSIYGDTDFLYRFFQTGQTLAGAQTFDVGTSATSTGGAARRYFWNMPETELAVVRSSRCSAIIFHVNLFNIVTGGGGILIMNPVGTALKSATGTVEQQNDAYTTFRGPEMLYRENVSITPVPSHGYTLTAQNGIHFSQTLGVGRILLGFHVWSGSIQHTTTFNVKVYLLR